MLIGPLRLFSAVVAWDTMSKIACAIVAKFSLLLTGWTA